MKEKAPPTQSSRPGMLNKMPTGTAAGLKRLSPGVYRNALGDLVSSKGKLLRPNQQQRPSMSVPTRQQPQGPQGPYDVFAQPVNLSPEQRQQMGIDPNDPNLYGRMPDGSLMSTQIGMFPNQSMQNKPGQFTQPAYSQLTRENWENMHNILRPGFGSDRGYRIPQNQIMQELPQWRPEMPQNMDPYARYVPNQQAQMRPQPINVGKLGQALGNRMTAQNPEQAQNAQLALNNYMAQYRR